MKTYYTNHWLEDESQIKNMDFPDMYYFESLCFKISAFLKNAPVPITCKYINERGSFLFRLGIEEKYIKANVDISYFDFITLIKCWASKFYPTYSARTIKKIPCTACEMRDFVTKGMFMKDALEQTKDATVFETGIIQKVFITEDTFLLLLDECREIRISGSIKNPLPISQFMKNLRKIVLVRNPSQDDIRNYIMDNSHVLKSFSLQKKPLNIQYSGKQMYNFFVINYALIEDKLIKIDNFNYTWGKFKLKFESISLRDDCIRYYEGRENGK